MFFKAKNQQLLNIFEIDQIKIVTKFNDKIIKNRATTTIMKRKTRKKRWKKFKNNKNNNVMTIIENKLKIIFF